MKIRHYLSWALIVICIFLLGATTLHFLIKQEQLILESNALNSPNHKLLEKGAPGDSSTLWTIGVIEKSSDRTILAMHSKDYLKLNFPVEKGCFFTASDSNEALVGREVIAKKIGNDAYVELRGTRYKVIGQLGRSAPSPLDNYILINSTSLLDTASTITLNDAVFMQSQLLAENKGLVRWLTANVYVRIIVLMSMCVIVLSAILAMRYYASITEKVNAERNIIGLSSGRIYFENLKKLLLPILVLYPVYRLIFAPKVYMMYFNGIYTFIALIILISFTALFYMKYRYSNTAYTISFAIVLALFILSLQMLLAMKLESNHEQTNISDLSSKKAMYQLMDSFVDPDRFYNFRESPENIDKIANFYNALSSAESFSFLSVFTQPIYVKNYTGSPDFLYSEHSTTINGAPYFGLKSLQLNEAAYNYYDLRISSGDAIDFSGFDYIDGTLPILVGSRFEDWVTLGQQFEVDYYSKSFRFEVVGILEPNTYIYYKGDPEYYLDQMMVVPYPKTCHQVNPDDFFFEGILYFAMINGDLSTPYSNAELSQALNGISVDTDFSDFSVSGLPNFNIAYDALISVLTENQNTLVFMMFISSILVVFMQYEFGKMFVQNKLITYSIYYIEGSNDYKRLFFKTLLMPYLFSIGLSLIFSYQLFRKLPLSSSVLSALGLILLFIPTYTNLSSHLKLRIQQTI